MASTDDRAQPSLVHEANGNRYTDVTGNTVLHYYWVRHVNSGGQVGGFNALAGTAGQGTAIINLADLLLAAAAKLHHGQDLSGMIPSEITQPINLRFAEIGHGSSRLYITGDTSPDLFGVSLLENSLSGLFDLLNQDINQGLSEQVDNLGLRSSHALAKFLKALRQKHIEIDISWTGGNEQKHIWHGRRDKIQMLETLLDGFSSTARALY